MSTSPSLLERLKFLCPGSEDPDLYKDIEAYLAKQREPRKLDIQRSILIEGISYTVPTPVACELLRLHLELQTKQQVEQEPESFERLAKLGWNAIECSICGSHAMAYPKPAREPMSDDEVLKIWLSSSRVPYCDNYLHFYRAIEAHHGIGVKK